MTNDERNPNARNPNKRARCYLFSLGIRASPFFRPSTLGFRHFPRGLVGSRLARCRFVDCQWMSVPPSSSFEQAVVSRIGVYARTTRGAVLAHLVQHIVFRQA